MESASADARASGATPQHAARHRRLLRSTAGDLRPRSRRDVGVFRRRGAATERGGAGAEGRAGSRGRLRATAAGVPDALSGRHARRAEHPRHPHGHLSPHDAIGGFAVQADGADSPPLHAVFGGDHAEVGEGRWFSVVRS